MPTLKPLTKKLRLTAFAAVVGLVLMASTAIAVRAEIYCLSGCDGSGGETFWLSCGSSAGNYFALCPAGGGPCTVTDSRTDPEANIMCQRKRAEATKDIPVAVIEY